MSPAGPGRLFGVGVGPGDPELVTVKARRIVEAAGVIAFPGTPHGPSVARSVVREYLRPDQVEVPMHYPVTTGESTHPDGYEADVREFYDRCAEELAGHLDAGLDVAVLCVGDPFFYGSYMYLHDRLAQRYETEVIPGVTSVSAATAVAGTPLVRRDDVLTVLPGTLPPEQLAARLQTADAAAVIKLGRTFGGVREALDRAGLTERAIYVERATHASERIAPLADVEGRVPYMSLALVPAAWGEEGAAERTGEVAIVGLGPAGPEWLTPEAQAALASADTLVGYGPYLARVPERPGQIRHASDNREEDERAREALALAAAGSRVAVVSSGDPGIYAMAAAVIEALDAGGDEFAEVDVRVCAGVSAMQAAAARVGAPLGHDFCVISLSDRLKGWDVIERRLDAAAGADLALALYNPASRSRREQLDRAREVLLRHRDGDTPVVLARAVGHPEESIRVETLAGFPAAEVDMRTLLLVGSSTTRVVAGGNGVSRVYTPRRYPA